MNNSSKHLSLHLNKPLLVITGPTASGKTRLAAHLAAQLNGEIISADSRQVYRDMTIGTGKDYTDYIIDNQVIPYHLIDIVEAGEHYHIARYQTDFKQAYQDILARNKQPILCGGTGMYIEAVLKNYNQTQIPIDETLREQLLSATDEQLLELFQSFKSDLNVDISTRKRLIRGIEMAKFLSTENSSFAETENESLPYRIFCLNPPLEERREKIQQRLIQRIENEGLIDETQCLLNKGISAQRLIDYGLEYKYIVKYLQNELNYEQFVEKLTVEIHRFAKRQLTFFRSMEKRGLRIEWIDGSLTKEEQLAYILHKLSEANKEKNNG